MVAMNKDFGNLSKDTATNDNQTDRRKAPRKTKEHRKGFLLRKSHTAKLMEND